MADNLKVKLEGESLVNGRIPVDVLAKVLKSVQSAIYAIGEYEQSGGSSIRQRGPVPKKIRDLYTLELINTAKGSFTAELDLPAVVQDMTQTKTFSLFYRAMTAVSSSNHEQMVAILPDRTLRDRFAKSVLEMLPLNDEYTITFAQGSNNYSTPLSASAKPDIKRLLSKPLEEVREVVGKIVELKILGDSYIGVYQNSKIIKCSSPDIENEAFQSIGKEAILRGEALLNQDGTIKELVTVQDVFIADPGKLPIESFIRNGYQYKMCEGFFVELDYINEYWGIEHEDLGIFISESRLNDAVEALYVEIEFLVNEYMKATDEELTIDAIELKNMLGNYVESVVAM
ncbi:hypothetical protein HNO89_000887 [Sporosarcina luteola]|nr:hypothetical protein [Sporosarcina luteola]